MFGNSPSKSTFLVIIIYFITIYLSSHALLACSCSRPILDRLLPENEVEIRLGLMGNDVELVRVTRPDVKYEYKYKHLHVPQEVIYYL